MSVQSYDNVYEDCVRMCELMAGMYFINFEKISHVIMSSVSFTLLCTSLCSFSGELQQQFHSCMLHLVDFSLIRRPNEYDEL